MWSTDTSYSQYNKCFPYILVLQDRNQEKKKTPPKIFLSQIRDIENNHLLKAAV